MPNETPYTKLSQDEEEGTVSSKASTQVIRASRPSSKLLYLFAILPTFLLGCLLFRARPVIAFSMLAHEQVPMMTQNFSSYEIPPDVTLDQVLQRQDWSPVKSDGGYFQHASQADIVLPLSAPNLFMIKRASSSGGKLDIISSPSQSKDSVTYKVTLKYNQPEILDEVLVSRLGRSGGEAGVGVFDLDEKRGRVANRLELDTIIILPEASAGSEPITVRKLETDVPSMPQWIQDLKGKVRFNFISLYGSSSSIHVESIDATTGFFRSSNGAIRGTFNTTRALHLDTSNAPIDVNIGLHYEGVKTSVDMRTSNGPLKAAVSLTSTSSSGPSYDIDAKTSNNEIDVDVPMAPMDSKLNLHATTSNGGARVSMYPAYEGPFSLKSSSGYPPSIKRKTEVTDPSGLGRTRQVLTDKASKGLLYGSAFWGQRSDKDVGQISVRTSQGHITLEL